MMTEVSAHDEKHVYVSTTSLVDEKNLVYQYLTQYLTEYID
jgi:hypothetical protein